MRFVPGYLIDVNPIYLRQVACDGGGGALGHPKVYINLDKEGPQSCIYCGLRYQYVHKPWDLPTRSSQSLVKNKIILYVDSVIVKSLVPDINILTVYRSGIIVCRKMDVCFLGMRLRPAAVRFFSTSKHGIGWINNILMRFIFYQIILSFSKNRYF